MFKFLKFLSGLHSDRSKQVLIIALRRLGYIVVLIC